MVRNIIHFLQLDLISNGPDESYTLSVLEVVYYGFFNFSRIFTVAIAIGRVIEAVLKVLSRTDFTASLVLDF